MKLLLTGAGGYLGSEMAQQFSAAGHELWVLTRQHFDGPVPAERCITHDLTQAISLDDTDFDVVIHAAGANDIVSRDPDAALRSTTLTTRRTVEFALQQKRPRFIYISTFQVYGKSAGGVDESTACRPLNDYASTHLFSELWVEQIARMTQLEWIHLRPANISGIPSNGCMQRWTLVPGSFCKEAYERQRITLQSAGVQQRDFLPISEVACRAVDITNEFDRFSGSAVNICAGSSLSIREVADLAAERYQKVFGVACPVFSQPERPNEVAPALEVDSRYFNFRPDKRLGRIEVEARLIESIDKTYHLLGNHHG